MCTKVRKVTHWKLDLGRNFYNRNIDHAKFERTNPRKYSYTSLSKKKK